MVNEGKSCLAELTDLCDLPAVLIALHLRTAERRVRELVEYRSCKGVEGIGEGGSGGCGGGRAVTLTTRRKETNSSYLTEGSVRHFTIVSLEAHCC